MASIWACVSGSSGLPLATNACPRRGGIVPSDVPDGATPGQRPAAPSANLNPPQIVQAFLPPPSLDAKPTARRQSTHRKNEPTFPPPCELPRTGLCSDRGVGGDVNPVLSHIRRARPMPDPTRLPVASEDGRPNPEHLPIGAAQPLAPASGPAPTDAGARGRRWPGHDLRRRAWEQRAVPASPGHSSPR